MEILYRQALTHTSRELRITQARGGSNVLWFEVIHNGKITPIALTPDEASRIGFALIAEATAHQALENLRAEGLI